MTQTTATAPLATPPSAQAPGPRPTLLGEATRMIVLYSLSAAALTWVFPAWNIWPLAFVSLVPWTVATLRTTRAWLAHWLSFVAGFAFFLVALRWLMPVTGLGYVALCGYLAIYWTLAAWAIRTAHRHKIAASWSLPVAWVACEYLRGVAMSGFPWLFLAHGLYGQLPLIQISDLAGAYGVSFLAAMCSGVIAEWLLKRWPAPGVANLPTQRLVGTIACVALFAFALAYGYSRLLQADFENDESLRGPRVAVIQEDFPLHSTPSKNEHPVVVLARYLSLAAQAAREKPDLIAFPETVWGAYQNIDFLDRERATVDAAHADTWWWGRQCHRAVSAFARGDYEQVNQVLADLERLLKQVNKPRDLPRLPHEGGPPVAVLVGSVSLELFPESTYPRSKRFNSALFYDTDGAQRRERYDKRHLVPFGEVVPFRQARWLGLDLHYWLYRPLNKLSPFSDGGRVEYSLWPGDGRSTFAFDVGDRHYRFATPICYESTTPYIARGLTWDGRKRRADFLINISNDGWFLHSHELPQHMAINVFRAIENRVSVVRSVNTGISGFIDPNGRIYSRVTDAQGRSFRYLEGGVVGYDIEQVPIDWRSSFYGRTGDWLPAICSLLAALLWLSAVFERWVLAIQHRVSSFIRRRRTA